MIYIAPKSQGESGRIGDRYLGGRIGWSETESWKSELVRNPPSDVTELFDSYNVTLADLLDKHAPLRDMQIKARPTAPWFDADCHAARVKRVSSKRHIGTNHQLNPGQVGENSSPTNVFFTNGNLSVTGRQPSVRVKVTPELYGQSFDHCYTLVPTPLHSWPLTTMRSSSARKLSESEPRLPQHPHR